MLDHFENYRLNIAPTEVVPVDCELTEYSKKQQVGTQEGPAPVVELPADTLEASEAIRGHVWFVASGGASVEHSGRQAATPD